MSSRSVGGLAFATAALALTACGGRLDDFRLVGTYELDGAASKLPTRDDLVSQLPAAERAAARAQLEEGGDMAPSFAGSTLELRGDRTSRSR